MASTDFVRAGKKRRGRTAAGRSVLFSQPNLEPRIHKYDGGDSGGGGGRRRTRGGVGAVGGFARDGS